MRLSRPVSAILIAVLLCVFVSPAFGQDDSPPGPGDILSRIAGSVGTMFQQLTTPYQPPLAVQDIYSDIPHSRTADGAFVLGDPNAPITLVEFADWACPHCINYKPVMDQFIDTYVRTGQAAYEFRMFPTAGGQMTAVAAEIAECADQQRSGAFWSASEALYDLAKAGKYNDRMGTEIAKRLGLDSTALFACRATAQQVATDYNYAFSLGVGGTPAVMIRHGGSEPAFITRGGTTYNGGGVPFDVLQYVMEGGGQAI